MTNINYMSNQSSYVIGVDYGSDSVRTIIVNATNGEELLLLFYYPRWKKAIVLRFK